MKHRDYTNRIIRVAGGLKNYIQIERFICPMCGVIKRDLPNTVLPYKQYSKAIIFGVINGRITTDTIGYEDYPCYVTMERWKCDSRKKQGL